MLVRGKTPLPFRVHRVIAEIQERSSANRQQNCDPAVSQIGGGRVLKNTAGQHDALDQARNEEGAGAGCERRSDDYAERQAFRKLVQRHAEQDGRAHRSGAPFIARRQHPAVKEAMQQGSYDQRSGESVEWSVAGIVIVRVGTGGTDRVEVPVDDQQDSEAGSHQAGPGEESKFQNQLWQHPEQGNHNQNGATERDNPA